MSTLQPFQIILSKTFSIFVILPFYSKFHDLANDIVRFCYRYHMSHCFSPQSKWYTNLTLPANPVLVVPAKRHCWIYLLLAARIECFYICESHNQSSKRAHMSNPRVHLTMSLRLMCFVILFCVPGTLRVDQKYNR